MKYNRYNTLFENGDKNYILYNCLHDEVIVLLPEIKKILDENRDSVEKIEKIHPEFYQFLTEKKFVVPDEADEVQEYIQQRKEAETDGKYFSITINPTLDCNFHCWYCYEKVRKGSMMSEATLSAVKKLLKNKLEEEKKERIHISFFGGEPLLGYRQVIEPLIDYIDPACKETGTLLSLHFTTNGYLLTPEMVDKLAATGCPITFQVTLDGNRENHNMVRFQRNGERSYDTIIQNIEYALKHDNVWVQVRFNYTANNSFSFINVVDDFRGIDEQKKKKLQFNFHQVWQDIKEDDFTQENIGKATRSLQDNHFQVEPFAKYLKNVCYANYENSVVINYDGSLYKCTARDFTPESNEGVLQEDGTLVWNEKYLRRMNLKYANRMCQACKIFPICSGGCSQDQLEGDNANGCVRGRSPEDQMDIIKKRVEAITK